MSSVVEITHDYAATPKRVWNIATDFAAFHEFGQVWVKIHGMPEKGRVTQGQQIDVDVRVFGWMPKSPYSMHVIACDNEAMTFTSDEHGAGVKQWRHTLAVTPTETGARLTDRIELDAGVLTPLFRLWARVLYKSRHAPRLRLLNLQED